MTPTRRWLRIAELYKRFIPEKIQVDVSEKAANEFFLFESTGVGDFRHGIFGSPPFNGFHVGKHWMDITIGMWVSDKWAFVDESELRDAFPPWFLNKVNFNNGL